MADLRLPFMPLFVDDFLSSPSVLAMNPEEFQAYTLLLCVCWASRDCSLSSDDESLANLSRLKSAWKKAKRKVMAKFVDHPEKPGFVTNLKLRDVWIKSQEEIEKKSRAGRTGAKKRWQNDATAMRPHMRSHDSAIEKTANSDGRTMLSPDHQTTRPPIESPCSPPEDLFGPLPEGWHETPDLEALAKDRRVAFLTNLPELGFGWNDCKGAYDRTHRDVPRSYRNDFESIRGDPQAWADALNALRALRGGLPSGNTYSLKRFLTGDGIQMALAEAANGKRTGTTQQRSLGLNAVQSTPIQAATAAEELPDYRGLGMGGGGEVRPEVTGGG